MLAYTAIDGLRAISRDFDLNWQPDVNEDRKAGHREWRASLRAGRSTGRQALGAFLVLLPLGAIFWQQ
jgi:hypothetical protein